VCHGSHRAARLLARLLQMPAEADEVNLRLRVESSGDTEVWRRQFGSRPMVTSQSVDSDGILRESVGALELQFRLSVDAGGLFYQQSAAGLRIGARFVALPVWIRPIVSASEKAGDGPNSVVTCVTASLPRIGLLLSYAGRIEIQENEA
jgi:hypothetical protein